MSGETKFTPGPWKAAASGSSIVGWPVVAPKDMGRMICNVSFAAHSPTNPAVPGDQAFNAESRANAHLIAAAPDMYEALEALKNEVMGLEAAQPELTEAIGVTNLNCLMRRAGEAIAALAKARGESQ